MTFLQIIDLHIDLSHFLLFKRYQNFYFNGMAKYIDKY